MYRWSQDARFSQLWPEGCWRYWLILAGRGFGKTRAASENIVDFMVDNSDKTLSIGLIGRRMADVINIMIEGPSGIIKALNKRKLKYKYIISKCKIIIGSTVIIGFGAINKDTTRGMEFDLIWMDEMAKMRDPSVVFEQANLCLRKKDARMIITTTPRNIVILEKIKSDPDTFLTVGTTYHNSHLPSDYLRTLNKKLADSYASEEIFGEVSNNYFWTKGDFIYKNIEPREVLMYHVGIDVAVGPGMTGIILSATIRDGLVVIKCLSTRSDEWIDIVIQLAKIYYPLTLDYEVNQGGNLLTQMFKRANIKAKHRPIRVTAKKQQRHKMLSIFYKMGRIYHLKPILTLELAMIEGKNLDHIDALFCTIYFADKRIG